jgi:hypothetical protein
MPAAAPTADPAHELARSLAQRVEARAALYATSETPPSPALSFLRERLEPEQRAALDRLRHAWHARLSPFDEAERNAVDAIVTTLWRQGAAAALEDRLLAELLEGRSAEAVRTLAILCRFRSRLEKDRKAAERDLTELFRLRPKPLERPGLGPERLEWLAAKLRLDRAKAEERPPRQGAPEPPTEAPPAARPAAPTPRPEPRPPENPPAPAFPTASPDRPAEPTADPLAGALPTPRPPGLRARLLGSTAPAG